MTKRILDNFYALLKRDGKIIIAPANLSNFCKENSTNEFDPSVINSAQFEANIRWAHGHAIVTLTKK